MKNRLHFVILTNITFYSTSLKPCTNKNSRCYNARLTKIYKTHKKNGDRNYTFYVCKLQFKYFATM